MPSKQDKIKLGDALLDRRSKLIPCQKEMVGYWHLKGLSANKIAKMFNVSKRTIQFIIDPNKLIENKLRREERGGWKQYANKERHRQAIASLRKYKREILPVDLVPGRNPATTEKVDTSLQICDSL
jgi:transposase